MRPTVFAQVIGYKTARSTWEALDRAYTSQTNARYYQIKHDLSNIRKGSYSITKYMDRIRRLTDELSLIQQPMSDREILGCLLDGLDLDYDVVVNTVHTSPSATTLKARHLSRHISVFFSTTGPGINPISFTRSRFPDGQAAYNTCTFWTPTQEARQQPRRDLSEFS